MTTNFSSGAASGLISHLFYWLSISFLLSLAPSFLFFPSSSIQKWSAAHRIPPSLLPKIKMLRGLSLQPGCISSYNCLPSLPPSSLLRDLTQMLCLRKTSWLPTAWGSPVPEIVPTPHPARPELLSLQNAPQQTSPKLYCKNSVLTTCATQILESYPKGSSPGFPFLSTWHKDELARHSAPLIICS